MLVIPSWLYSDSLVEWVSEWSNLHHIVYSLPLHLSRTRNLFVRTCIYSYVLYSFQRNRISIVSWQSTPQEPPNGNPGKSSILYSRSWCRYRLLAAPSPPTNPHCPLFSMNQNVQNHRALHSSTISPKANPIIYFDTILSNVSFCPIYQQKLGFFNIRKRSHWWKN